MIALLTFLIRSCSHLFDVPGFRFKDSAVGKNSGEGSYVLLESDDVQIYASNEREQITLQIRSLYDPNSKNWFSFDLVSQLLGQETPTGVMDAANCKWLSKNLEMIISRFRKEHVKVTLTKLNKLKAERSKRL